MDKLTYGKVWPGCRLEELGNKELYCGRSFSVGGRGGGQERKQEELVPGREEFFFCSLSYHLWCMRQFIPLWLSFDTCGCPATGKQHSSLQKGSWLDTDGCM